MEASGTRTRRSQRIRAVSPPSPQDASRRARRAQRDPALPLTSSSSTTNDLKEEDVAEDDLCPICRLLLYRPVITRCNHTLCESCMAQWADVSITSQMTIVDVDEEPVAFNPVSGLEAKCPMCRTQTSASLDHDQAARLAAAYPATWEERRLEEQSDDLAEGGGIQTLTVYVGNRHHQLAGAEDANQHEWTFFVKPSRTDIIEEIQIYLHPTFRPRRVIRQQAPYEIRRLGWGTFTISAHVMLKPGYTWVSSDAQDSPDGAPKGILPLNWTLDFDGFGGKGSMGRCRLKVRNDRGWQEGGAEEQRDQREWQRTVRQYQRDGRYQTPEEEL